MKKRGPIMAHLMNRQSGATTYVGTTGQTNPTNCNQAAVFRIGASGTLTVDGVALGVNPNTPFIALRSGSTGSITATFTLNNGVFAWSNAAFSGGQAGFCQDNSGQVYATFGTTVPPNCTPVTLSATPRSSCTASGSTTSLPASTAATNSATTTPAGVSTTSTANPGSTVSSSLTTTRSGSGTTTPVGSTTAPTGGSTFVSGGSTFVTGGSTVVSGGSTIVSGSSTFVSGGSTFVTGGSTVVTGGSTIVSPTTGPAGGATTDSSAAAATSSIAPNPVAVDGFSLLGCFASSSNFPSFVLALSDPLLTLEKCTAACPASSRLAGLFGTDCYCGDIIDNTLTILVPEAQCNTVCPGNPAQRCGGRASSVRLARRQIPTDVRLTVYVRLDVSPPVVSTVTSISVSTGAGTTASVTVVNTITEPGTTITGAPVPTSTGPNIAGTLTLPPGLYTAGAPLPGGEVCYVVTRSWFIGQTSLLPALPTATV
ncbi:wsc domain-containing protein [Colletotrichum scovillei]|nr:wsc domain-containing protein [Colletotrichum scovillei]